MDGYDVNDSINRVLKKAKVDVPKSNNPSNSREFNSSEFNSSEFNSSEFNSSEFNSSEFNSSEFNSSEFNSTATTSTGSIDSTQCTPSEYLLDDEDKKVFYMIYDPVHIAKTLRNLLISDTPIQLSTKSLEYLDFGFFFNLFTEEHFKNILIPNDIKPSDKMALDPVKRLFSSKVIDKLNEIKIYDKYKNDQIAQYQIGNLIKYLSNLGIFYNIFNANKNKNSNTNNNNKQ